MVIVTVAYLLTNISYYTVMTSQDVLESNAVAMVSVLVLYPIMVFMILAGELFGLIHFYSFPRWLFIGLTTMGLMIHRYQNPDLPRPFKVYLFVPAVFTVVCFFIVGMSLYSDSVNTGISFALTLTGFPVYFLLVQNQRLPLCFIRAFCKWPTRLILVLEILVPTSVFQNFIQILVHQ
uniref:Uncharacterized protein n=1 Tax=Erpetoichthys calabaricus TaxID=27687 RepID=A0A8C4SXP5_ERPCA